MICKRCGKNNAEIYYKQTINGQTVEYALCSSCAEELKKEGKLNIKLPSLFEDFDSVNDHGFPMLSDIFGLPFGSHPTRRTEKKKCTLCASTFDDLVKSGKVGCAKCYEVFADELKRSVESIHGKAKYMGKKPKKYKDKQSKEDRIKELRTEMQSAIDVQDFERAATLRDQIRGLENEN